MDFSDEKQSDGVTCLETGLAMNCALLIKDATDCDDTAMDSTDDIGGLLKTVVVELVTNDDGILPDIPIMPRFVLELGTELDGIDGGTIAGGAGFEGGPTTTDVTGLILGAGLRIGKEVGVAIVDVLDIEREATEETRFPMSVEWFVSEEEKIKYTLITF
jgi:hypothetical protein